MTPDELERATQFLLNWQAQFAADLADLRVEVRQTSSEVRQAALLVAGAATTTARLGGHMLTLADAQRQTEVELKALAAAQHDTQAELRGLAIAHREADTRLDALIDLFERHLRHDHGPEPS